MLRMKTLNYFDKDSLIDLEQDDYDVIIEYDETEKHDLNNINDYILQCYDTYNGVSDLNFHNNKL